MRESRKWTVYPSHATNDRRTSSDGDGPTLGDFFRIQRGIAEALRTGYLHAEGRVLVFYPADLQFKPEDIPRLVAPILADESDMVTGYKQGVYEKAFVSRIYNRLSRLLFHVPVRDLNNVKA